MAKKVEEKFLGGDTPGLDSELAEAAGLDDADLDGSDVDGSGLDDGAGEEVMAVPQPAEVRLDAAPASRTANTGLLAMLLVMVVGIVCLFMFGFQEAAIYSMPVDQFLAQKDEHVDRRVRLEGELVPGTLVKRDKPCEYRFQIKGAERQLEVRYSQCVVPDTFRDVPEGGVEVTAEGSLSGEHFEADLIMAKCSSKYDAESHTMIEGAQAKAE